MENKILKDKMKTMDLKVTLFGVVWVIGANIFMAYLEGDIDALGKLGPFEHMYIEIVIFLIYHVLIATDAAVMKYYVLRYYIPAILVTTIAILGDAYFDRQKQVLPFLLVCLALLVVSVLFFQSTAHSIMKESQNPT